MRHRTIKFGAHGPGAGFETGSPFSSTLVWQPVRKPSAVADEAASMPSPVCLRCRNSAAGAKTVSTRCNLLVMGSRRSPLWRNTGDSSPGHTAVRHEVASGSGSGSLQAACDQGRTHTGRRSRRTQTTASARPSVRSQGLLGCDLTENRKLLSGALCVCVLPGLQVEVQRSSSNSS